MRRRWFLLATVVIAAGCGEEGRSRQRPGGRAGAKNVLRLKRVRCIDSQGIGSEAFSLLVPKGWTFNGGVSWPLDCAAMPAKTAFTVTGPSGLERLQVFPDMLFFWTEDPALLSQFPVGSRYQGTEVRPLTRPAEVLQKLVIPSNRHNVRDLRVVEVAKLPELARDLRAALASAPAVAGKPTGGKVKVEYKVGKQVVEEEFYAVVGPHTWTVSELSGTVTKLTWLASCLFAFRAPKGQLADHAETFHLMVRSFRLNAKWFSKHSQLVEALAREQIREIEHIGQITRLLAQTTDEISDPVMESYKRRSAVYGRLADQFRHVVRGVDHYHDPVSNERVALPAGYDRAWTNGLGDYVLTTDPDLDPNAGSDQKWTPLKR